MAIKWPNSSRRKSNILPTIAIDEALQKNGKSAEEAFELILTHMWAALTPEKFRKMSRLRGQKCDFCFVRHRKGEVWERTESI